MSDRIRAYVFHFTGVDGKRCTVTVDLVLNAPVSREQATSNALAAVIRDRGAGWIKGWECTEVH